MRIIALLALTALLGACVEQDPYTPDPHRYPIVRPAPQPDPIVRPIRQPRPEPIIRPRPQPVPQPHPRDPRPRPDDRRGCDARQYQHMVGSPMPDPFPRRGAVRVYRSDMSVTMEHNPNRLNVEVHPRTRRIVSVTCG